MQVTIELFDQNEIAFVSNALSTLMQYRTKSAEPEKSPVIAHITPEGVQRTLSAPAAVAVSDEEIKAAVLAYADKAGMAACVALLSEYGAKRAGEIPLEQRAAFIARTA